MSGTPTEAELVTVNTCSGRIAAKDWHSSADALPVIALHGWLDNAASFDLLAPHLTACRLFAIDLVGHGHSEHRPAGVPYHLIDSVRDVIAVADEMGWERFGLLGHSLGAAVATLIAGAFPERIRHMALIEGLGPLAIEPDGLPDQVARSARMHLDSVPKTKPVYTSIEDAARARKMVGDIDLGSARILVKRGLQPCEGGWTWRADPRLRLPSPLRLSEQQVRSFVCRINTPSLLILGESGFETRFPEITERAGLLKGLRMVRLPGSHHLHMDHGLAVAEVLNAFFCKYQDTGATISALSTSTPSISP